MQETIIEVFRRKKEEGKHILTTEDIKEGLDSIGKSVHRSQMYRSLQNLEPIIKSTKIKKKKYFCWPGKTKNPGYLCK